VSVGEDALGEASVEAEFIGKVVSGRAVSTDIIEASALAFLQVINRVSLRSKYLSERIRPTEAPPVETPAPRAETKEPASVS
jgi:2-isopropylmalate synthase